MDEIENIQMESLGETSSHLNPMNEMYYNHPYSMHRNDIIYRESQTLKKSNYAKTGGRCNKADSEQVQQIFETMKRDKTIGESDIIVKNTLREMPKTLTLKRRVMQSFKEEWQVEGVRGKKIGCWKNFMYKIGIQYSKFIQNVKNLIYQAELWYGCLKEIEGQFGSGVGSFFRFLRWMFLLDIFQTIPIICFLVIPQMVYNSRIDSEFHIQDLFTGEGYLAETSLFYSYYSNGNVNVSRAEYNMPQAYFFTNVVLYVLTLIILCVSAATSYRSSFIETEGAGVKYTFAQKVFCGWDFSIDSGQSAELKKKSLYTELKELLGSVEDKETISCGSRTIKLMVQIFSNLMVAGITALVGYGMWELLKNKSVIATAVTINLVMLLAPIFLNFLAKYEEYKHPKTGLYLNMARTFLLGSVIIGVLVTFWLKEADNQTIIKGNVWENSLGQEIYRLLLFDFIFSVLLSFLFDIILFTIRRSKLEYDISRHVMHIIYNQALFWMGLFFAPLLSVMVVIKLLLTWYIRQITVIKLCKLPEKTWRAAKNTTYFKMMSFLALLFICFFHGYIIMNIPPTRTVGPFRDYNYTYEIVTVGIFNLQEESLFWQIIFFILRPACVTLIMLGLCTLVYMAKKRAEFHRDLAEQYRKKLKHNATDRKILLMQLTKAETSGSRGLFSPISKVYQNRQGSGDFGNNTYLETEQLDDYQRSYNSEASNKQNFVEEYESYTQNNNQSNEDILSRYQQHY
ncbi:transmembrane channel-like protein 3 isoform X2 [Aethina tumida]|nr:transmembrane channel-like protein 3 isoform X2 [Aethina tumida]